MESPVHIDPPRARLADPVPADLAGLERSLASRGIDFAYCATDDRAREFVLSRIPRGATVMNGGSATLERIGILDALRSGAYEFLRPGINAMNRGDERVRVRRRATTADYFVGGVNAITVDGEIVNVDGSGNRLASYAYGAGKVLMVAGINKIVPDLASAIARIRSTAAPEECRHLGKRTPCAITGVCDNAACRGEDRQCGKMLIIEDERIAGRITVVMIGEAHGY